MPPLTLLNHPSLASGGLEFKNLDSTALIQQLGPLNLLICTFIGQQYFNYHFAKLEKINFPMEENTSLTKKDTIKEIKF